MANLLALGLDDLAERLDFGSESGVVSVRGGGIARLGLGGRFEARPFESEVETPAVGERSPGSRTATTTTTAVKSAVMTSRRAWRRAVAPSGESPRLRGSNAPTVSAGSIRPASSLRVVNFLMEE